MQHSSVKWCGWGQGPSSSGGRQALLHALSTFSSGVGIANPSLFCFPFQTHPLPFLAGGASPSPFAEICSLARLPFSPSSPAQSCCQTSVILAERTSYFFHGWSRFGSCLHTHNGCSGSAPVLGALQNFYRLPM